MKKLSIPRPQDIQEIIEHRHGACISIYMTTHQKGQSTLKNPIRLKNLLSEAESRLSALGIPRSTQDAALEPARGLLEDHRFWQYQTDGLAIFAAPDFYQTRRSPLAFKELVTAGPRFHIKPLSPLFSSDGRFYVLARSQRELRFFQGTRELLLEVEIDDVPKSLADALKYDQPVKQLAHHTLPRGGPAGGQMAIFHGHGTGFTDNEENILRYFRQIDDGVGQLIGEDQAPMVLAGVDYIRSIYVKANTYAQLMPAGISGNPEEMAARQIHRRAWDIVTPHFEEPRNKAIAKYSNLANTDRASADLEQVVRAAQRGQVDKLLISPDAVCWGSFDQDHGEVHLHADRQADSLDLLDLACAETLVNGGEVFALQTEQMPGDGPIAAIFRYPLP